MSILKYIDIEYMPMHPCSYFLAVDMFVQLDSGALFSHREAAGHLMNLLMFILR
jgi:hypothetical protein